MTDDELFVRNLRILLAISQMSQSELARRMIASGFENYNQMTVNRTLRMQRPVKLGEARALAALFGTTVDAMLSDHPTATKELPPAQEAELVQLRIFRDRVAAIVDKLSDLVRRDAEE